MGWVYCIRRVEQHLPVQHTLAKRYAHRGLWDADHPENSLSAFRQSWTQGYAMELDVRLTRDGHVVVSHDGDTGRMSGQLLVIARTDLAALQALPLGETEERIPTLQEVLAEVQGRVPLLIEVKRCRRRRALCRAVLDLMGQTNHPWAVESFDPWVLRYFRHHAPHIMRGQLILGRDSRAPRSMRIANGLLQSMVLHPVGRPHFLACEASVLTSLPYRLLGKKRRPPVLVWTVRSKAEERSALTQADGIIFEGYAPHS